MKACITGGAGFIGSNLVDRLLELKYEVIVVDNLSSGKKENLPQNPRITFLNRSVLDSIDDIVSGCSVVFHLAAIPQVQFSIKHPVETHAVNVDGTLNVLNACVRMKVKRFVFSSSAAVYGDQDQLPVIETMEPNPMSPYALHKLIGEQYCRLYHKLYGLETVCLRYFNVYGPRQNPNGEYSSLIPKFIRSVKSGKLPVIFGDGEQTRDFVFVSDVVNANVSAATIHNKNAFGEVFNIGSGEKHSVNEVARTVSKISGRDIEPSYGPSVIEPRDSLAGIGKAKQILKWQPKVSFEEGLSISYTSFPMWTGKGMTFMKRLYSFR